MYATISLYMSGIYNLNTGFPQKAFSKQKEEGIMLYNTNGVAERQKEHKHMLLIIKDIEQKTSQSGQISERQKC